MEKPLVTISIITYNQERYVRDAVRGLLSQTYEPLEIVISDDHSSDGTWDIIKEEVENYRAGGGSHKNIVLNRNPQNFGIVKHCNFVFSLQHGTLRVSGGGDDISLPDRVRRIVEEWERTGRQATIFHHGYEEIDTEGRPLRISPPRSAECALGATSAYAARVFEFFPPLGANVDIEDQVWAKRALMLGPEVRMPDVLVKYRVGCGVSTKFNNARERMYKHAITMAQSCEQVLEDLEKVRDQIMPERYDLVYEMAKRLFDETDVDWRIASNLPFAERFRAVLRKCKQGRIGKDVVRFYFQGLTYLQPWGLGNIQRQVFSKLCCIARKFWAAKGK